MTQQSHFQWRSCLTSILEHLLPWSLVLCVPAEGYHQHLPSLESSKEQRCVGSAPERAPDLASPRLPLAGGSQRNEVKKPESSSAVQVPRATPPHTQGQSPSANLPLHSVPTRGCLGQTSVDHQKGPTAGSGPSSPSFTFPTVATCPYRKHASREERQPCSPLPLPPPPTTMIQLNCC